MDARPAASWGQRLARAVVALGFLFALLLGAAAWFFSSLLAAPGWMAQTRAKHATELAAFTRETRAQPFEVRTRDGLVLRGLHLPARPDNDRFVVMVHGYCSNLLEYRSQYAQWHAFGFDVFLYDHRFCGSSDGAWTTCGVDESRDLGAVLAEARRQLGPQARGGLYGRSMGGAVVLMCAAENPDVAFVVADCPFSSFPKEVRYRLGRDYGAIPRLVRPPLLAATNALVRLRYGFDLSASAPDQVVGRLRMPVLYTVTVEDTEVPPEMTRSLHALTKGPTQLREFPRGGHGQAWQLFPADYDATLRSFIATHAPHLLR